MMKMTRALVWLYRVLLMLYPASHRVRFGAEMVEVFEQTLHDAAVDGGWRVAMVIGREVWGLPVGVWRAYRHEPRLVLAGAVPVSPVEQLAVRLQPWVLGMVLLLMVVTPLYTFGLGLWATTRPVERPVLRGASALILEDDGTFVRLPSTLYHCDVVTAQQRAVCRATIADEPLQLVISLTTFANGGFSGSCGGTHAERAVDCLLLFGRAKDYGMSPILVQKPHSISDAQWQMLRVQYAYSFPHAAGWLPWGWVASVLLSVVVWGVIWLARRAMSQSVHMPGQRFKLANLVWSVSAASVCGVALGWLTLVVSLQLEHWLERF